MVDLLGNPFVGVHELRKELTALLEQVQGEGVDLVVTQQGKPAAVMMSVERYLELQQALRDLSDPEYVRALLEARREIREGQGITIEEALKERGR
ncbi:MAG: type II toxin-antitoxin system Phd/YefM family antitoxin [Dehalococcoidia bacterium]|nr:type II toxin-antitoxin system Phd/YefM family antitoxin [Dehalococcoidia bacterium]